MRLTFAAIALLLVSLPSSASAATAFGDKAQFFAQTGATSATGALPNLGSAGAVVKLGSLTFDTNPNTTCPGCNLQVGPSWTDLLPGNEIAVNGDESFDVTTASPVTAFGFDFVEPTDPGACNAPCVDSTFSLTLKRGATTVGSTTFNAPNDVAAFAGISSDVPFDRIEIREIAGGIDNELFGQFYTAAPPPPPPPPPPPAAERNVALPRIDEVGLFAPVVYRCGDGEWEGLAAAPGFRYSWWEAPLFFGIGSNGMLLSSPERRVATTRDFKVADKAAGKRYFCQIEARMRSGRTLTARSATTILSGDPAIRTSPFATRPYGNFRVRGIDVFQTVQPLPSAQMFGFPNGAFGGHCRAGVPSSYRTSPRSECLLDGRDPARTAYEGVPLDARKPTTALVYVNTSQADAAGGPPLYVTLRARLGGKLLQGEITSRIAPAFTPLRYIDFDERGSRRFNVRFSLPAAWLALAWLSRDRLDLEATATLPVGAGAGTLRECALVDTLLSNAGCTTLDNRFRLDGLNVVNDLPELTIRSLPLLSPGQTVRTLNSPESILARAVDLFPAGERLSVLPYAGSVDVGGATSLEITDAACKPYREAGKGGVRACRAAHVDAALKGWLNRDSANREGYNILMAVHRYQTGEGFWEPGWKPGKTVIGVAGDHPTITVNDGNASRPLTAAAHELLHAFGAPHADIGENPLTGEFCGGNLNGQVAQAWPPDNIGRLQGVAFGQNRGGRRNNQPLLDRDEAGPNTTRLFDLMSYCANESNAWLSPFNWNRLVSTMRAFYASEVRASAEPRASASAASASTAGTAFVSGVVGPGGAAIDRVVPRDPDNLVPAADPKSAIQVRALGPGGRDLGAVGASVQTLTDAPAGTATFTAPVPGGAEAVEVLADGKVSDRVARTRPPNVRVLAPRAGLRVRRNRVLRVRWRTTDPDSRDTREATVEYAPDGRAWRTVWRGPDRGAVAIAGRSLPRGGKARLRVTINDGFNSTTARSKAFSVDGSPPTARIATPTRGQGLHAAAAAVLTGRANNDAGLRLGGRALTWFAGRRRLGTGAVLRTRLPAGRTRLRLVVRDRWGRRGIATRTVRVEPVTLRLTRLLAPQRVGAGKRRAILSVATTTPATLRAGGQAFAVGPRARRLAVPLPRSPRVGVLRVRLRIVARGEKQRPLRQTVVLLRL